MPINISSGVLPVIDTWQLVDTQQPVASASINTAALTAFNQYMVIYQLQGSSTASINIRINTDAGSNYYYLYIAGTTITSAGPSSAALIGYLQASKCHGEIVMSGVCGSAGGGQLDASVMASGATTSGKGLSFTWVGGANTQITSMTFFMGAGNMTGVIQVYGRNAP